MKDVNGKDVPAMHACGHDIHMSVWLGTISVLNNLKNWKGKIIFVAQPAEEIVVGALAMLEAGLYQKFGKPDYCIALHDASDLPAGKVAFCPEYAMASVNSINITVKGVSGHGAYPHNTVDPVVMAAKLILDLQTIISRDIPAIEPAVLTVGTIHGGTKRNIIPDEVRLECTLRTYNDKIKDLIIEKIREKARGVAVSEGLPENNYPVIEITPEHAPSLFNNLELTNKVVPALERELGKSNVAQAKPVMVSEDFGHFGMDDHSIPVFLFWLGAVDPKKFESYKSQGKTLPSLHSSTFLPEPVQTIQTGVQSMSAAIVELMK
jgi:amidohydrolase